MPFSFQTPGYENLELSTQVVIAEALKRGLKVEVLDEKISFIRISNTPRIATPQSGDARGGGSNLPRNQGQFEGATQAPIIEYIQQATCTSRDSYVTSLILGNKLVQKQILREHGISTPQETGFFDESAAIAAFQNYKDKKIVIKPKSTNFGIGVHVFAQPPSETAFQNAVREAFTHDNTILIEDFFAGKEYRFLIIGPQIVGILNRVPANVIGDSTHTIAQLVELKNDDERRGEGYKRPLEKIRLGEIELAELAAQNLTPNSVPKKDEQIFLRNNSNISTGGDSIDCTDNMHQSYKDIAVKAAQSCGATFCGIDMIVQNPAQPATPNPFEQAISNPSIPAKSSDSKPKINRSDPVTPNHTIIELNFNPALHLHNFPYQGKNRNTGKYVLDVLGF